MYKINEEQGMYFLIDGDKELLTPMKHKVTTRSLELAERLSKDMNKYGCDPSNPISIVAFHYAMLDFFSILTREELEHSIAIGLSKDYDWTLDCGAPDPNAFMEWWSVFGNADSQISSGLKWIKSLNLNQLCAVCVIGRALESVNIPYILSTSLKSSELKNFIAFIDRAYPYIGKKNLKKYFENYFFFFNLTEI